MLPKYQVNTIYPAILGEGWWTGMPVTIVRLQGCNLKCSFCLGPKTKVRTLHGKVDIRDLKIGDEVLGWDGSSIELTTVVGVYKRPVPEVYRIEHEQGRPSVTFATREHPFYVIGKGWVEVGDLREEDELLQTVPGEIISLQKSLENPMWVSEIVDKKMRHTNYAKVGQKVSKWRREHLTRQKNHCLDCGKEISSRATRCQVCYLKYHWEDEAFLEKHYERMMLDNPMDNPETVKQGVETRAKLGRITGLERHLELLVEERSLPLKYVAGKLAIGNSKRSYRFPDFVVLGQRKVVEIYSPTYLYSSGYRRKKYEQDTRKHYGSFKVKVLFIATDFRGGSAEREKITRQLSEFIHNGNRIVSVRKLTASEVGRQCISEVYNLKCEPYHNFFIGPGILTHNCDTPQAISRKEGETLTLDVLFNKVKEVHHNRNIVLLTGGEPALQRLDFLVPPLTSLGPVHLETNGTLPIPDAAYFSWVTVSPKPSTTLDATALGRADEIKWLVSTEEDVAALCKWLEGKNWVDFKRICLQPLSCEPEATEIAYQACLKYGYRLSLQTHKLIGKE